MTTFIDGVGFEDCYQRRIIAHAGEVPVNVIGLDDLGKNKKASGRQKDLADLESRILSRFTEPESAA